MKNMNNIKFVTYDSRINFTFMKMKQVKLCLQWLGNEQLTERYYIYKSKTN